MRAVLDIGGTMQSIGLSMDLIGGRFGCFMDILVIITHAAIPDLVGRQSMFRPTKVIYSWVLVDLAWIGKVGRYLL